jgi:hypothetical protein
MKQMTYDSGAGGLQVFSAVDESLLLDVIVGSHIEAHAIHRAIRNAERLMRREVHTHIFLQPLDSAQ